MSAKRPLLLVLAVSIVAAGLIPRAFAARPKKTKAASAPAVSVKETQKETPSSNIIVDPLDTMQGWDKYTGSGSKLDLYLVPGKTGKAIEAVYVLAESGWIAFNKKIDMDLSGCKAIKFFYKGEGSMNTLDIKLEDADGTNFQYVVPAKTNAAGWTAVEIPFSDFTYCWGEDRILDFTKILRLHFAVSRKEDDEGGSGKVMFGRVEGIK